MNKKPDTLLGHLEAWAQEEIGAQQRLFELLRRQEAAVCQKKSETMRQAALAVEAELARRAPRDRRRRDIFAAFAKAWDVPAGALTLGSIAERLGDHATRLLRLRAELFELTEKVQAMGRRASVLVRQNQAVLQDVVEFLVDRGDSSGGESSGRLLDARV